MTGRAVVPVPLLSNLQRRIPEAGRIRIGEKTTRGGKTVPTAIDVFRFTSADADALEQIATVYGGKVTKWSDTKAPKGQYQVKTTSAEIQVALPPGDPLSGSPIYELWGGGGCERRCDGEMCTVTTKGPEGPEFTDKPCVCSAKGALACKVKVRLNLLLPDVRFTGTWRLETSSAFAAEELPGMVEMIQDLHTKGLSRAVLRLTQRRSTVAGETHHYVVPTLGLPVSIQEMMAGGGTVQAIASTAADSTEGRALAPGAYETTGHAQDDDDDVVDAEVIPDDADVALVAAALAAQGADGMAEPEVVWHALHDAHGDERARLDLTAVVAGDSVLRMSGDGTWTVIAKNPRAARA